MAAAMFNTGEHLVCSICLDVVTRPVTTPCGHNFCKACIQQYWDTKVIYQCPLCNTKFPIRPQMQVNTVLSAFAIAHEKWAQDLEGKSDQDILCDICKEARKDKAAVSCLECLTSFCATHLEPHRRVESLRHHTLSAPISGLEDRLCRNHHRLIEFYCKTDQAYICGDCMTSDHKNHHMVLLETEYKSKSAEVQSAINARSQRLRELKQSTRRAGVFSEQLIRHRPDLVAVIADRCRAAKQQAEGFITELNMDIAELVKKRDDLAHHSYRLLKHPHLVLLLSSLPALLNKDLKNTVVDCNLPDTNCVKRCAVLLDQEVTLQRLGACAVDVTLDPDTAHRDLIVSPDGKTVMLGPTPQDVPDARRRFKHHAVLAKKGFTRGKFYFEVQVKRKTSWALGVASASLNRRYPVSMSRKNECWVIVLDVGRYRAYGPVTSAFNVLLEEKPQAVGVFVDHDVGEVSFYNGDTKTLIYTFSGQRFNGRALHPYLCTSARSQSDPEPLTITT